MNVIEIEQVGTTAHVWVEVENMNDETYDAMCAARYAMGESEYVVAEVVAHHDTSRVEVLFN